MSFDELAYEVSLVMKQQQLQQRRTFKWFGQSTLMSILFLGTLLSGCRSDRASESPPTSSQLASTAPQSLFTSQKPPYVRPTKADNGVPFPRISGYIDKYPVQLSDGYSTITVDNAKNNSDVFVKLFSLESDSPKAVRVFFIRAGEAFTVEKVRAGTYDVRYRDLDSGGLSRTEEFTLQEVDTGTEIQFSKLKLTLYKVPGGNMKTSAISDNEF